MSRPLRIEFSDAWYHVMNCAGLAQEAFPATEDYLGFRAKTRLRNNKFKKRYGQIFDSLLRKVNQRFDPFYSVVSSKALNAPRGGE